jgi:SAM-dependent methyltransferase
MEHRHLPYTIDPRKNRFHFYENYWKQKGCELLLRHQRPDGKTLLDYGCGRGEALEIFGHSGFAVTGTDADAECVRIAAEKGKACQLDIENPVAQFGPKSFDTVICFHVLEHVDNPKAVLTSLGTLARDYLVLAVPNLRHLAMLFKRSIVHGIVNEGHLHGWDHWHFLNLATRHCGLELVEWGHDATILPIFNRFLPYFGNRFAIWVEAKVFARLLPWHCNSVLGIFRPVK